jgi:DivIVA domain-containing protein
MTSSGSLTGDEVRRAAFKKPPLGKRGYDPDQVDAFMQRVAATLDGSDTLTADDVRYVIFRKPPIGNRGYDEEEVDAMLDVVAATLRGRADGVANRPVADAPVADVPVADVPGADVPGADVPVADVPGAGSPDAGARSAEPLSGYQVRQAAFRISPLGGYDRRQVDEFMARAADTLDGSGVPLSLEQVQGVGFGRAKGFRRGYHLDEVDGMIQRIAAELRRRSAGW